MAKRRRLDQDKSRLVELAAPLLRLVASFGTQVELVRASRVSRALGLALQEGVALAAIRVRIGHWGESEAVHDFLDRHGRFAKRVSLDIDDDTECEEVLDRLPRAVDITCV